MFDRYLVLDDSEITDTELQQLLPLVESRKSDYRIPKFRRFFKELSKAAFDDLAARRQSTVEHYNSVAIADYFEDDAGNPLDEVDLIQVLSGQEYPVIMGNARSVLRIGPIGLKDKPTWTQDKSDNIAHFLQLANEISQSRWVREPLRITFRGASLTEFQHPSKDSTRSFVITLRQLWLTRDDALNLACNIYLQHAGDARKAAWVKERQDSFAAARRGQSAPQFISEYTIEQIIDVVTYGAGITHRTSNREWEKELPQIVAKYGPERLMFSFGSACRELIQYAIDIAYVLSQDLRHWIDVDGCPPPQKVFLCNLLAS